MHNMCVTEQTTELGRDVCDVSYISLDSLDTDINLRAALVSHTPLLNSLAMLTFCYT